MRLLKSNAVGRALKPAYRAYYLSKWIVCVCVEFFAISLPASEYFVAPTGSPNGNGSLEQPWDLQTALNHPTNVVGGDTIWLRGGIYRKDNHPTLFSSDLAGVPGQPIIVRRYPGERAIVDGNISQSAGGSVSYWGFEIMNSHTNRLTTESGPFPTAFTFVQSGKTNDFCVSGFDLRAPDVQLINLVIHDSIGGGIGANVQAANPSFSGVLSFYNGWQGCDRSHGHGLYSQNVDPSFVFVRENLFFSNYGLGIQATSDDGRVDNFFMEGTALFFNSVLARKRQANFLLGPYTGRALNSFLIQNFLYDTHVAYADVNIGHQGGAVNPQLYNNYFQTPVYFSPSNETAYLIGNNFLGGTRFLNPDEFPDNIFSTNRPELNVVEVRPNLHEPGRVHVIVYNWENATNVAVDLSFFVNYGTEFEVRNAQDFLGAPILSGTYTGELLQLPLTGLRVAKPIGTNAPPSTAPEFNVFVVLPREIASSEFNNTNTAPNLLEIGNQITVMNVPTAVVPFTVNDAEMPASFLTFSVHSSNPELVPNPNIQFGGDDTNRTLTIVPAPDEFGTTIITLAVSDGFLTVSNVFAVEVTETNVPANSAFAPVESSVFFTIGNPPKKILNLYGPWETKYEVQASTNLSNWDPIGVIAIDCSGVGYFLDEYATNFPERFYRIGTNPPPDLPIHD